MRRFRCDRCTNTLFFENTRCLVCESTLGFLPGRLELATLQPDGELWRAGRERYRMCLHYARDNVCNWMIPEADPKPFCAACRLNEVIPDLSQPENQVNWARLEAAKRYLLYGLMRLGLPFTGRDMSAQGLGFAFLADEEGGRVMTGHAGGLITINVHEADDAYREAARKRLGENYRTLLGHFRHESGHYFWQRLVAGGPWLERFRALFGDERQDYAEALARHYQLSESDWRQRHISAYAAAHPWEDWAETWGHYLLVRDTLETAADYGLPQGSAATDFPTIIESWLQLSLVVNGLGRSLGMLDLYPFVLVPPVVDKLRFVHEVIEGAG